ncbi:hypothetical protein FACS18945_4580 [Bacteroidia bacterium]|nr:hypothetical protein FACS18945_4580 [Bacteroidia bacterium]
MAKENTSNFKYRVLFTAIALVAIGAFMFRLANMRDKLIRTVDVVGECNTKVVQDRIAITLHVKYLDKNPAASVNGARELMNSVASIVEKIDDDTKELQTIRFDSYEKTEWNRALEKSITLGFQTDIDLEISTADRQTIDKILAIIPESNFIMPGRLRMYSAPNTLLKAVESCLGAAVKNARAKADAIAVVEDLKAGRIIAVSYGRTGGFEPMPRLAKMSVMSEAMDSVSFGNSAGGIYVGDSDVSVSINARFELK